MNEWKTYKLGEICDLVAGFAFKSKDFGLYPNKVVKIADIQPPIVSTTDLSGVNISSYDTSKLQKYVVKNGDYVLAMTGATIGKLGRIVNNIEAYVNQRVLTFRPNISIVDKDFLYYQLSSICFNKYILNHIDSETAQPNISAGSIGQYEIQLPPLDKQKAIANILKSLDEKIKTNRRINDNLEQQAQALYKQWFVDNRDEDWEEYELNDVATITAGGDKPQLCTNKKTSECSIPIYSNGIEKEGLYGYTNVARIFENAITISARGTIGFVCLRTEPYVPIVRLISVVPMYENLSVYFLYLWAVNQNISGTGTTQQQLTVPDFRKTKIIIPHQDLLMKFNSVITPIFNCIKQNKEENDKLVSLRDTLLPKLMSGELSVDDVSTDLVC